MLSCCIWTVSFDSYLCHYVQTLEDLASPHLLNRKKVPYIDTSKAEKKRNQTSTRVKKKSKNVFLMFTFCVCFAQRVLISGFRCREQRQFQFPVAMPQPLPQTHPTLPRHTLWFTFLAGLLPLFLHVSAETPLIFGCTERLKMAVIGGWRDVVVGGRLE